MSSGLLRWITGAHLFLGAWIFIGYVVWWEINHATGSPFWMHVRIAVSCIITLILLEISLNLMGKTHIVPRLPYSF
ncbi:hypothetical protein DCMF_18725 [Candidatus Formimonas warabiya]|uniref:Uncharacterized protein n=1 Tax=Formimonas warabiya TaxID=1761012 RepID=A0A3G1KVM4_FORW1|nr:hypothetical protein DCMF_18725 [Candidatus Formimonas warabiya]